MMPCLPPVLQVLNLNSFSGALPTELGQLVQITSGMVGHGGRPSTTQPTRSASSDRYLHRLTLASSPPRADPHALANRLPLFHSTTLQSSRVTYTISTHTSITLPSCAVVPGVEQVLLRRPDPSPSPLKPGQHKLAGRHGQLVRHRLRLAELHGRLALPDAGRIDKHDCCQPL